MRVLLLVALVVCANAKVGFFNAPVFPTGNAETIEEQPLILTGMDPKAARAASRVVGGGLDSVKSYSGFFTTQPKTNNSMYFWYFEPKDVSVNADDAPLLIWLQGGPGGSSLFGLFSEMGPYTIEKKGSKLVAVEREVTWNDKYAMLFIDNPVGAGFSFTTSAEGFCQNTKECVSRNLYSLLQQFYDVFPEKLTAPLYITGESYGGKYVPGLAFYIHEQNQMIEKTHNKKIPLEGIAVGDGWTDPINMIPAYPELMYNVGLISASQREEIRDYCIRSTEFLRKGNYMESFRVWDQMLNGDIWPYGNLFHNMTGLNDYDNYMNTNGPESFAYYADFVNQADIRRALHVGNSPFPYNPRECEENLLEDFMVSFRNELGVLMDNYKVLLYSGQLDVIIGATLTEAFLPFLEWRGKEEFSMLTPDVWRISNSDKEVAGYVRQTRDLKFTYALVRGGGHIVPYDQPQRCRDMIERFIQNIPYSNLPNPL